MRSALAKIGCSLTLVSALEAQAPGKWPPDSLINPKVFAKGTPMSQVISQMRSFSLGLDVSCQFCHVGADNTPLPQVDFASDAKRTKLVAREMLRMVQDINRRFDSLPQRPANMTQVSCVTCHRGVSRPVTLATVIADAAIAVNADSALRAYAALRARYFGKDAYDFTEASLNIAAIRAARARKVEDGLKILDANAVMFPNTSMGSLYRGTILLLKPDTTAAVTAFRRAVQLDSTNGEARLRLRELGARP